jgi:putative transposase
MTEKNNKKDGVGRWLTYQRKSHTSIGEIYFWTATIHKWLHLLGSDANKQLILDYLKKLSSEELISVYGFVIMPNHIHLLWQQNKLNGKETPKGSLLKYTGHEFLKKLREEGHSYLYEVNAANKKHEIWQRDSLGVEIYTSKVARQKLEYIHNNPVSGRWQLATDYLSYPYSSAKFYETGVDEFGFLENIFSVFYGD